MSFQRLSGFVVSLRWGLLIPVLAVCIQGPTVVETGMGHRGIESIYFKIALGAQFPLAMTLRPSPLFKA